MALTTHLHIVPRLKKEYSHTSTSLLGLHGMLQVEVYLYLLAYTFALPLHLSGRTEDKHVFSLLAYI